MRKVTVSRLRAFAQACYGTRGNWDSSLISASSFSKKTRWETCMSTFYLIRLQGLTRNRAESPLYKIHLPMSHNRFLSITDVFKIELFSQKRSLLNQKSFWYFFLYYNCFDKKYYASVFFYLSEILFIYICIVICWLSALYINLMSK